MLFQRVFGFKVRCASDTEIWAQYDPCNCKWTEGQKWGREREADERRKRPHKEPSMILHRALWCPGLWFFSNWDHFHNEKYSPQQPGGGNMPKQLLSGLRWLECRRNLSMSHQSCFGSEFQDHSRWEECPWLQKDMQPELQRGEEHCNKITDRWVWYSFQLGQEARVI